MYAVSGMVENRLPDEQQRGSDGRLARARSFWVVRIDTPIADGPELYENVGLPRVDDPANRDPSHVFELRGVPPGVYDLYPIVNSVVHPADRAVGVDAYTTRTRVTVGDRDVVNVRAIVRRGHGVTVREESRQRLLEATDPAAAPRLAQRRVWLSPREPILELVSREHWRGRKHQAGFGVPSPLPWFTEWWLHDVRPPAPQPRRPRRGSCSRR